MIIVAEGVDGRLNPILDDALIGPALVRRGGAYERRAARIEEPAADVQTQRDVRRDTIAHRERRGQQHLLLRAEIGGEYKIAARARLAIRAVNTDGNAVRMRR